MRLLSFGLVLLCALSVCAEDPPRAPTADASETERLLPQLRAELERLNEAVGQSPNDLQAVSRRGDVHFFLADFDAALADYDRMVEIDPSVLPLHWRRGLALYYVGRYEDSAKQFERYFEQDKSDRENGIWRFYAQTKQYGIEEARRRLLPYVQPDRAPLPDVYDLCAGKLTVLKLEERLSPSGLPAAEQAKRQFYGQLYLGLDYALKGDAEKSRKHLTQAVGSEWAQNSGYGPRYMWHIARLQRDLLTQPVPNGAKEGKR